MADTQMIRLRNKKTGAVVLVPRSEYAEADNNANKGLAGIGSDIAYSVSKAPEALGEMAASIVPGINNIGYYATTNNPVSTLANLGAGGTESLAGLLSSPQMLMRYLSEKFPQFGMKSKSTTPYEALMRFEQKHGLAPQSEEEASVRNAGGLLFGGKLLSKLPGMLTRSGTVAAESGGRGGDPVHATLLALIGEKASKALAKGIDKAAGESIPPAVSSATGGVPQMPIAPTANIGAIPNNPNGYMSTVSNIPKAALNLAKMVPEAAKKTVAAIPEMAGSGAASALESAADFTSELPMVGKLASPVLQPTMGALASYLKHISVAPEELAKRNLFGDIEAADLPAMEKMNEAAKRLGITYATPSELLNSPFESVKQANVGRTTKGMKLLYKLGKEREGSEEAAINKLFNLIHEDKLDPIKKAAYEQTMQNSVPADFIARETARPVIQKAMKAVENNTAYKQMLQEEYGVAPDNVSKKSFMYWDMVKRVLGDMESKLGRKGSNTEASVYGNTRRSMVKAMDAIEPQYKIARNIAERKFTRDELESVFDKKDKTFNNFYSLLKSKEKFNELMQKLDAFPEAKQQLQDIKLFAGNMIPNNPTIRAAAALKRTGMSDARNAIEAKKREFDEKYGTEHDVAAVNLLTHPDMIKLLSEYLKKKGK